jgi:hypothetical protein
VAEVVSIKAQKILIIISNSQKLLKNSLKLFNSKSFYKKIENIFKKRFKDGSWENSNLPKIFNQKKFTIKKKLNSK